MSNPGMETLPPIAGAEAPAAAAGPSEFDTAEPGEELPPASPSDEPDAELLTALQRGDVDAAEARIAQDGVRTKGHDREGWTLLHYCCVRDVFCAGAGAALLQKLLTPEAVKAVTVMGDTPLHLAALTGLQAVVSALLAAGADKELTTQFGDTPALLADKYGHQGVTEALQSAPVAPVPQPAPPSEPRPAGSAPRRSNGAESPVAADGETKQLSPQPPPGGGGAKGRKGRKGFMAGGLALDGGAIAAVPQKRDGEPTTVLLDDAEVSQITEWLYLGGLKDALKADLLREQSVTRIVQLAPEYACQQHEGFDYLKVQVEDHPDAPIKDHFPPIFDYLDASRAGAGKVFVHCRKGKSRSPTVVIAYFMQTLRIPFRLAKDIVRRRRSVVELNLGFTAALEQFETELGIDPGLPMEQYKETIQAWQLYSPMVDGGKAVEDEDDD